MSLLSKLSNILAPAGNPSPLPRPVENRVIVRPRAAVIQQGGGITSANMGGSIYQGTDYSGLNSDFPGDFRAADSWIRQDLYRARLRSRQLERDNPWMQAFKTALLANVLGPEGIQISLKIRNLVSDPAETGQRDTYAEGLIKSVRSEFERAENYTTHRRLDQLDTDRLLLTRLFFDGEFIVRRRTDYRGNPFNFSWQIIDPDYLDHNFNTTLENGNTVKMGVEIEAEFKTPVAYWFLHRRPNDYFYNYGGGVPPARYYRVPAEDIIHVFPQTYDAEQVRGFPLIFAAMSILQKENKYEYAALINALQGACRGIFYEKDFPAELSADEMDDLTDQDEGGIAGGLEPGMSVELPYGLKAKVIESQYPTGDLGPFVKTMLRAASAAVGQSYTGMTGDLSEANFSSLRAGLDGERANWMMIQSFFIRNWKRKERSEWLYRMLLSQRIPLPLGKLAKYDVAEFTGRRWTGVNPLQDSQTNAQRLNNRECSIYQIIREQNQRDPEEVLREIAESEEMMKGLGIARITDQPQQVDPEAAQKADDDLSKKNAGKVDKEDESK